MAAFSRAKFTGIADFSEAEFTGIADFSEAEFTRANFSETEFTMAAFPWAKFTRAAFPRTKFAENVYFFDTEFTEYANFSKAEFTKADFSHAKFTRADFSEATFEHIPIFRTTGGFGLPNPAKFSCKADPEDYNFKVSHNSPYKIETEEQEHNGAKFTIPKGAELFDPDEPSEQGNNDGS